MNSVENILLEISKNNLSNNSTKSAQGNRQTLYGETDMMKIQQAVSYYGDRKIFMEEITKADGSLAKLEQLRQQYESNVAFTTANEPALLNGALGAVAEDDKLTDIKNDITKMQNEHRDYDLEITNLMTAYGNALPGNTFTKDLNSDPILQTEVQELEKKLNDYVPLNDKNQQNAIVLQNYLEQRKEIIEKIMGQWKGRDWKDFSQTMTFNVIDLPTADVQQILDDKTNEFNDRQTILQDYKLEFDKSGQQGDWEDIKSKNDTTIEGDTITLRTTNAANAAAAQANQGLLTTAQNNYITEFSQQAYNLNGIQALDLNGVNARAGQRKQLLQDLKDTGLIQNYEDKDDAALQILLATRSNIFTQYNLVFYQDVSKAEKQKDNDALEQIIKDRQQLNNRAKTLFSINLIESKSKNNRNNAAFIAVLNARDMKIQEFKTSFGQLDEPKFIEKDNDALEQIISDRKTAFGKLEQTFETPTYEKILTIKENKKLAELRIIIQRREAVVLGLKNAFTGEESGLPNFDNGVTSLENALKERLNQYNDVVNELENYEVDKNPPANEYLNVPELKTLKGELSAAKVKRQDLLNEIKNLNPNFNEENLRNPLLEIKLTELQQLSSEKQARASLKNKYISLILKMTKYMKNDFNTDQAIINAKAALNDFNQQAKNNFDELKASTFTDDGNEIKELNKSALERITELDTKIKEEEEKLKISISGQVLQPQDLQKTTGKDEAISNLKLDKNLALIVLQKIRGKLLNETSDDLKQLLEQNGYNGENSGFRATLWIQNLTNIDTKGNDSVITFNNKIEVNGKTYNVLDDSNKANKPLFIAGKINEENGTSIGFKEKDPDFGAEVWINSWLRLTPNLGAPPEGLKFLESIGLPTTTTIYINLEDRKIYGRAEFLDNVISSLTTIYAYENREPAKKGQGQLPVMMNVKDVDFYKDGSTTFSIPLDRVIMGDAASDKSIIYYSGPSQTQTIKHIKQEFLKESNSAYPDLLWRTKIQKVLSKIILDAENGKGVSWDGSENYAMDMTDEKWKPENLQKNLSLNPDNSEPDSFVGARIDNDKLMKENILNYRPTSLKQQAIQGRELTGEELCTALFDEFQYLLFDTGNRTLLIHRITKYERTTLGQGFATPIEPQYFIQCVTDHYEGYCIRYSKSQSKNLTDLNDPDNKLFLFDEVDDVDKFNLSVINTVQQQQLSLLDTDDEDASNFRFIPNI